MSIGDKARAAREEQGMDPRPIAQIRAETPEPEPEPEPVVEPTPAPRAADPLELLIHALERLQPQQASGLTKDDLAELLKSNAEGMRKALKPENATHPDVSVFNPHGERDRPRPKLARKTFLAGMELHEDELDLEEIDLLNRFTHTKEARQGAWRAELKRTSSKGVDELHITFPCATMDDRMDLPSSMKLILAELHGGAMAVDPMALAARVAELERQIAHQSA